MKYVIFFSVTFVAITKSFAQVSSFEMSKDFKEVSGYGRVQTGFEGFQSYNSGAVNGSQFFADNWSAGSINISGKVTIKM